MAQLQPFQQRVVDEKKELDEKIDRLGAFRESESFQVLSDQDQLLLNKQLEVMCYYSVILEERISRFKPAITFGSSKTA